MARALRKESDVPIIMLTARVEEDILLHHRYMLQRVLGYRLR